MKVRQYLTLRIMHDFEIDDAKMMTSDELNDAISNATPPFPAWDDYDVDDEKYEVLHADGTSQDLYEFLEGNPRVKNDDDGVEYGDPREAKDERDGS